jgi:hypothetical protein
LPKNRTVRRHFGKIHGNGQNLNGIIAHHPELQRTKTESSTALHGKNSRFRQITLTA